MFAGLLQAVPGLNLLAKNTASLRFNSDWADGGNMRTPSTWGDAWNGWRSTHLLRIKTQTCPIFHEGHGAMPASPRVVAKHRKQVGPKTQLSTTYILFETVVHQI